MIATCGISSTHGSHAERKVTFFSIRCPIIKTKRPAGRPFMRVARSTLVGFLEALEQFVAALDDRVEGFFRCLLAGPHLFELLVFDGADLHVVAQADAA